MSAHIPAETDDLYVLRCAKDQSYAADICFMMLQKYPPNVLWSFLYVDLRYSNTCVIIIIHYALENGLRSYASAYTNIDIKQHSYIQACTLNTQDHKATTQTQASTQIGHKLVYTLDQAQTCATMG